MRSNFLVVTWCCPSPQTTPRSDLLPHSLPLCSWRRSPPSAQRGRCLSPACAAPSDCDPRGWLPASSHLCPDVSPAKQAFCHPFAGGQPAPSIPDSLFHAGISSGSLPRSGAHGSWLIGVSLPQSTRGGFPCLRRGDPGAYGSAWHTQQNAVNVGSVESERN